MGDPGGFSRRIQWEEESHKPSDVGELPRTTSQGKDGRLADPRSCQELATAAAALRDDAAPGDRRHSSSTKALGIASNLPCCVGAGTSIKTRPATSKRPSQLKR